MKNIWAAGRKEERDREREGAREGGGREGAREGGGREEAREGGRERQTEGGMEEGREMVEG